MSLMWAKSMICMATRRGQRAEKPLKVSIGFSPPITKVLSIMLRGQFSGQFQASTCLRLTNTHSTITNADITCLLCDNM